MSAYASNRKGSGQWLMQRASAVLLIGLTFSHFAIQHFTSDAVSAGLTVARRFNDPWWQGYYIVFIVLALYHGVNGLVGIVRDYQLRPVGRGAIEILLWTLAAVFGAVGIINIVDPVPLADVKDRYARNGFAVGESAGSPPIPGGAIRYDFQAELRELHLLAHYLENHTARTETTPLAQVFGHTAGASKLDAAAIAAAGKAFDEWAIAQARTPVPLPDKRDKGRIFSSTQEFAVWAAHVRMANAGHRLKAAAMGLEHEPGREPADRAIVERYANANIPVYRARELH